MAYPVVNPEKGVSRQVLTESPEIMLVRVQFEKGARGAPHQHPHVQSTFVREGRFQFTVGDKTFEVKEGDAFVVPGNTIHGCMALENGVLIDCFTPRRDDFL